jgi:hypothetical protein
MSESNGPNIPVCLVKALGAAGAAFLTTAACVDNLVEHLFGPGMFWLIVSPLLAGAWGMEYFCTHGGKGTDEDDG